uniref:ATP synthase F0 subunit 8 n=1 Tax=Ramulus hainanense TaxID=556494 RepID=C7SDP3_9NEOP|nr:ATP synthase F0 subunit 8 [Ramulus hainanense]ACH78284.1 ATP synthase F0 subunit 8 [Ramulus hainanense]
MPQMAPMSWATMYMYIIMMMLMFNYMIYFNKSNKLMIEKTKKNNHNKNWKW